MQGIIRSAAFLFCFTLGAAATAAPDVTVLSAFPAASSANGPKACPDASGAAGPEHLVEFTDANVVIQDKKTGKVLMEKSETEFWKTVKPGFEMDKFDDPRVLYDPLTQRWFMVISYWGYGGKAIGHLAVSETADPTKSWRGVKLPMAPTDPGMKMGIDRNGLYIAYSITGRDIHTMQAVHAIAKSDAIAADGPNLANIQTFENLEAESFPATDLDPSKAADAPENMLCHEFGNSFGKLFMYKITWSGKTAAISKLQTIPLSKSYTSPNGSSLKNQAIQPAPGGKLRADEGRRTLAVWQHNGSLFSCNGAKRDLESRCGIFWCEVRASDGALLQEALIDDKDCDYLIPSLAVDAKGNVGIGCTRTSDKEFASAVVMMRAGDDPKNTMRPAVLGVKGTTVFSSDRQLNYGIKWGNYNATCLDPSDPTTIWTVQEYGGSAVMNQWSTCWVAFKLK